MHHHKKKPQAGPSPTRSPQAGPKGRPPPPLARLAAVGLLLPGRARSETAAAAPAFPAYPFALGVASGDPSPTGVVLWTRIAPLPLQANGGMPNVAVEVEWEMAADERFNTATLRGRQIAYPELGHTVHAEVEDLARQAPDLVYQQALLCGQRRIPQTSGSG